MYTDNRTPDQKLKGLAQKLRVVSFVTMTSLIIHTILSAVIPLANIITIEMFAGLVEDKEENEKP